MMNSKYLLITFLLILLTLPYAHAAEYSESCNKKPEMSYKGKPQAPVEIEFDLFENEGVVTVKFSTESKDIHISVKAIDGAELISSSNIVNNESFLVNETEEFEIEFVKGEGQSYIAVFVSGLFNGRFMQKVKMVQVGKTSEPERNEKNSSVSKNSEGKKVIIFKVD